MIIRQLTEKDIDSYNEVSSSSFIWNVEPSDNKLPEGIIMGALLDDDKTVTAALECIPFECFFGTSVIRCVGIGGVCSKPEYRRGGTVRAIFGQVFRMSAEHNWDFSLLGPFSIPYYRKFGYDTSVSHLHATAPFTALSNIARCGDVEIVRREDADKLIETYNRLAKSTNLLVVRRSPDDFYCDPYTKCEYTYLYLREGQAEGYVSFKADRATSCLTVKEILFADKEALLGLLGFLRTYDGNFKTIEFSSLPLTTPLLHIIDEPRAFTVTRHPGDSGRIFNMTNILKANRYPEQYGRFSFWSKDTVPACAGVFTVEYEKGVCEVTHADGGAYDFSVTPDAAAKLFLSGEGFTEEELSYLNGVEQKNSASAFLHAFPKHATDFNKGF